MPNSLPMINDNLVESFTMDQLNLLLSLQIFSYNRSNRQVDSRVMGTPLCTAGLVPSELGQKHLVSKFQ